MKKLILSITTLVLSSSVFAQKSGNIEIGGHMGLPIGDVASYSSVSLGVNLAYNYPISDNFQLGIASGWGHYARQSNLKFVQTSYIPITLRGKYYLNSLFLNVDAGAAIYSNTLGFYAFPKVGYRLGNHEIYLGYQHLSTNHDFYDYDITNSTATLKVDNANYGSINIGYNYIIKFK